MAAKKAAKKTHDFNVGQIRTKRFDGSGDVHTIYRTPSSIINARNAARRGIIGEDETLYCALYYSALSQGLVEDFGIEGVDDVAEGTRRLEDVWLLDYVDCDDDGNPVAEEDVDPT